MPKATKKAKPVTTKTKRRKVKKVVLDISQPQVLSPVMPSTDSQLTKPVMSSKFITVALVCVLLGLLTYKLGPKVVPATVDGSPIFRFTLWNRLEKSYGAQALDDMINERILDNAIASANLKIDQAKVSEQIKTLETQFEPTGGLDGALAQRGMSRKELEKQILTQLSIEELLADKITPSAEEVKAQFDAGVTTMYKDKKFDDVQAGITEELKQAKLRDEFFVWFGEIKKNVKVKNFGL